MTAPFADAYFHKTVALRAGSRRLELATSQELFSSHQVDRGSRLLLRTLSAELADTWVGKSVLDVGCGYGPLGLGTLALGANEAWLVDRDALAVHYAARNAEANQLPGGTFRGSVDYADVDRTFDVVLANIPGHASEAIVHQFVLGAGSHLVQAGRAGFVVVSPLAVAVRTALGVAGATVTREVEDRGHCVFVATDLMASPPRPADLYSRGRAVFTHGDVRWSATTAQGVPEFDSLSRHTVTLLDRLERASSGGGSVMIWNPGQGHVPMWLQTRWQPARMTLCDRDLVALRCSRDNLAEAGASEVTLRHACDPSEASEAPVDLYVDVLRRSEPPAASASRIEHMARTTSATVLAAGALRRLAAVADELADRGIQAAVPQRRGGAVLEVRA